MIVSRISLVVNLMVVDMTDYGVILRMERLTRNHASRDCYKKEVVFTPPSNTRFKFKGKSLRIKPELISMMKVKKLIRMKLGLY